MKSKTLSSIVLLPLLAIGGCAGPAGPPLGLGPELDQLVFFGFLIGIAVLAWPRLRKSRSNQSNLLPYSFNQTESRATAIAAERYAKGEITRDEYLKLLDDLRHQAT